MFLIFFLAPIVVVILGGFAGGLAAAKIIDFLIIKILSYKLTQNILNDNFNKKELNNRIKILINDPIKHNTCNIGLYNEETEYLEEYVEVKYSEIENSLNHRLKSENNLLIL